MFIWECGGALPLVEIYWHEFVNKLVECETPDSIYPKTRFFVVGNVFKFIIGVVEDDNLVLTAHVSFSLIYTLVTQPSLKI